MTYMRLNNDSVSMLRHLATCSMSLIINTSSTFRMILVFLYHANHVNAQTGLSRPTKPPLPLHPTTTRLLLHRIRQT